MPVLLGDPAALGTEDPEDHRGAAAAVRARATSHLPERGTKSPEDSSATAGRAARPATAQGEATARLDVEVAVVQAQRESAALKHRIDERLVGGEQTLSNLAAYVAEIAQKEGR